MTRAARPARELVVRRSRWVLSYWDDDGGHLCEAGWTGRDIPADADDLALVAAAGDSIDERDLSMRAPGVSWREVRARVRALARAGVLERADVPAPPPRRATPTRGGTGTSALWFHAAARGASWAAPADIPDLVRTRAADVPPTALASPLPAWPRGRVVTLPEPAAGGDEVFATLRARRTWRRFAGRPMPRRLRDAAACVVRRAGLDAGADRRPLRDEDLAVRWRVSPARRLRGGAARRHSSRGLCLRPRPASPGIRLGRGAHQICAGGFPGRRRTRLLRRCACWWRGLPACSGSPTRPGVQRRDARRGPCWCRRSASSRRASAWRHAARGSSTTASSNRPWGSTASSAPPSTRWASVSALRRRPGRRSPTPPISPD